MRASSRSWVTAAGMAGFGLLAGHQLSYLLLSDGLRAHVLASTAHGDLAPALVAACFGAVVPAGCELSSLATESFVPCWHYLTYPKDAAGENHPMLGFWHRAKFQLVKPVVLEPEYAEPWVSIDNDNGFDD